jgi:hypothetical protein
MRHLGAATIWVVAALILFMYLVFQVISTGNPITDYAGLLIASDHVVYIGVATNGALGVLSILVLTQAERSSWISHVMFWGVNLGLLVFVIGLIIDSTELKRVGAPLMGVVLLGAMALLALRAFRASDAQLAGAGAAISPG